jgi:hypothetical protein
MDKDKKIVVVAGNREQFRYWLRHNIIPVTNRNDVERLHGVRVHETHTEGTWNEWMDDEIKDFLKVFGVYI